MEIKDLQEWILSKEGLRNEIIQLNRFRVASDFDNIEMDMAIASYNPDWKRLILAASILAKSDNCEYVTVALSIALAGVQFGNSVAVSEACACVLSQLSNQRAIDLGKSKGLIRNDFEKIQGVIAQITLARRSIMHDIVFDSGNVVASNYFQQELFQKIDTASWISASAPTASGKTYLVLQWLLNEYMSRRINLSVFIAPTRALVSEIESSIFSMSRHINLENIRVSTIPLRSFADLSKPTILVFTQERLHVFLNGLSSYPKLDVVLIDEAHKISDDHRGVILEEAIDRIVQESSPAKIIFLSPLTQNPELLLTNAPENTEKIRILNDLPTVTQNIILANECRSDSSFWKFDLSIDGNNHYLGHFHLHARPDTVLKRISYVAYAVGKNSYGTLIYANGAAEAEKIAEHIYSAIHFDRDNSFSSNTELQELSNFTRTVVHKDYILVEILKYGVAFHYGNMPSLLRYEIERLFSIGKIKFLVCTSTLIEGVNLSCKTIILRGPTKGQNISMLAHDFWNLAGRAGRWGQDFQGNIICVDIENKKLWPNGVPSKQFYPIRRETDSIISNKGQMIDYINRRHENNVTFKDYQIEQVLAYLYTAYSRDENKLKQKLALVADDEYSSNLCNEILMLKDSVSIPLEVLKKHSGISVISLQNLLTYFRTRNKPPQYFIPSAPESSYAVESLASVLRRIHLHVFPVYHDIKRIMYLSLITINWMRGWPLSRIINENKKWHDSKNRKSTLPKLIRDTMRDVEEISRFYVPKYLSAYMDVLKLYLEEIGQSNLYPSDLDFDLYLEFGVSTKTLISLISLGLSRASAIALNEFIGNSELSEDELILWFAEGRYDKFDLSALIKKEVRRMLERRGLLAA
jgi:hypothetical protein